MNILLIGSGGREHALAWKLQQSPSVEQVWTAPGNAGTPNNVPLQVDDLDALCAWVTANPVDLVVVGPEVPLAAGVADRLPVPVFGPSQKAAELESSKAFAKAFMERHNIPTAAYASFTELEPARAYLRNCSHPVVLKASGLAAGKGVLLPDTPEATERDLQRLMREREFGAAGDTIVIEERLEGREVSLLALCDGKTLSVMPTCVDHKRLLDGDAGPNTGGMGAYSPDPLTAREQVETWTQTILRPALEGMAAEGRPFVGVLYAGLMLTADGPRVLEFNCRFGDPETQVILPQLEGDLGELLLACAQGRLHECRPRWRQGASVCVVMTAQGYPGPVRRGDVIAGLDRDAPNTVVFHAGTARQDERVVSNGGRVLGVTAWGQNLPEALERAYARVDTIQFEGAHFRRDLARLAVSR